MALVQYDSSDEDEDMQSPAESSQPPKSTAKPSASNTQSTPTPAAPPPPPPAAATSPSPSPPTLAPTTTTSLSAAGPAPGPAPGPTPGPALGPVLGPSRPPPGPSQQPQSQPDEVDLSFLDPSTPTTPTATTEPPRSPYTATRALLRDLTLPSHASLSIPSSPTGSPPPGHAALTTKFDTFLRLKRTQGVHFNERLAQARGMANPATADKLLAFVGLGDSAAAADEEEGGEDGDGHAAQGVGKGYATVLSAGVWDPGCFPAWAFKGALRRAQEQGRKERERGRGEAVEFVKGGSIGGEEGRQEGRKEGTPGLGAVGGKRKGRWD